MLRPRGVLVNPLAVMVDLGWPWWVTTIIAGALVLAAVLVLLRGRRAELRGAMVPLIVFGIGAAVIAPFVMSDSDEEAGAMVSMPGMSAAEQESLGGGSTTTLGAETPLVTKRLPFTFFFTRYEFLGDPNNPHTVRYHSDGTPLAKSPDGSTITMSGRGGWDPYSGRAAGGGSYVITEPAGAIAAKGTWRPTSFISFHQFAGWYGFRIRETGWQGPRGSPTFSGFLKLRVELRGYGSGTLTAWCAMPEAQAMHRADDGITLVGPRLRFTNFDANVGRGSGVMFYGPGASG
jgi:hypothetical protein